MRQSAWEKGVSLYASELMEDYRNNYSYGVPTRERLLNGADNWKHYSEGGCSLIYDCDIAERLCSPSELKRKRGGELQPNSRETWLDVQARALSQASRIALALLKLEVTK